MNFGVDISRYQKGFDFAAAKDQGVSFVLIKGSQSDFMDPEFVSHYESAKEHGIYTGVYHYLTATSVENAKTQARYMIDKCLKGREFEYPVFADVEDASLKALGKNSVDSIVKAFCDEIENAGYWAGFYCNYDFYSNYCSGKELADRYSLWLASWTQTVPADCQIWQFGGEVNLQRANTVADVVCDQDYSYVDFPGIIKSRGLNGFTPTPVVPPLKVGDKVRVESGAPVYGTDKKFQSWVYLTDLYVREIDGARVVVSTLKSGSVTGAVDKKYLTVV